MNDYGSELSNILKTLRQLLPKLKKKYHILTLEVFGSYIRNEQEKASDLDLLVTFSQEPSLFTFIELENYLSDQLGIQVDLVMRDALKPALGERILLEALPV